MPFQFRKEAIEEDLNTNFPSQGQGNPPLYYSLSEVVVPTYSINSVAEGSGLPENLQTAWDFSTGSLQIKSNSNQTIISNPGFWLVDLNYTGYATVGATVTAQMNIFDGVTSKPIWAASSLNDSSIEADISVEQKFVVFLRAGDSLRGKCQYSNFDVIDTWYRQIADVNGNLVNPLGFSFA